VEEVEDTAMEIHIEAAKKVEPNAKVGDTLTWKNAVLFVRKVRRRQAWEFHLKRRKLL
jgi:hypothetical protein